MNWKDISARVDGLQDRGTDLQKRLRSTRKAHRAAAGGGRAGDHHVERR